jgi:hypothetical protein
MKLLRLTVSISFIITLIVTHAVTANVCEESEEHKFLL